MKDDWGKDPYLYEDVPVLRNIPGVKNDGELKRIEGDLTKMTMSIVYAQDYSKFNADTLCHSRKPAIPAKYSTNLMSSFREKHSSPIQESKYKIFDLIRFVSSEESHCW